MDERLTQELDFIITFLKKRNGTTDSNSIKFDANTNNMGYNSMDKKLEILKGYGYLDYKSKHRDVFDGNLTVTLNGKGWEFIGFKNKQAEEAKIKTREDRQKTIDLKLAGWKLNTFWFVFFFGLIGGSYTIYDIYKKLTTKEIPQEKIVTKEMLQKELLKVKKTTDKKPELNKKIETNLSTKDKKTK